MRFTTELLAAVLSFAKFSLANPCVNVTEFSLHADLSNGLHPLRIVNANPNVDSVSTSTGRFGLSNNYPSAENDTFFTIDNGNLLVVDSVYGSQTYQATFIFNHTNLQLVRQFQDPPEDDQISLIPSPDYEYCYLAAFNQIDQWGLCNNTLYRTDTARKFVTYNTTGGGSSCQQTKLVVIPNTFLLGGL